MFVHLHCHSHYSFLRGVGTPEEIIAAAAGQQMPAVALTDTNGMYAAVPFYQAAKKAGVKPIVGVTLDVEWPQGRSGIPRAQDARWQRAPRSAQSDGVLKNSNSIAMVLFAADIEGYSNLCQLVTLRHLGTTELGKDKSAVARPGFHFNSDSDPDFTPDSVSRRSPDSFSEKDDGRPVTLEELAAHARGVIALSPLPTQERDAPGIARHFARLKDIFGDQLWIEVRHLSPGDGRLLREAERLSREFGIPLAPTNNVHFLRPEEHLHHRAVNAIRTGGLLTTVAPPEITTAEAWFKPAAEMQKLFPDHPELLRATLEIAGRCNLELTLNKTIFPEFPVPEGESAFSYLWKLCFAGAQKRYRPLRPEVLSRLTHELGVIEKLHLAPYFLLVWEIVEEAKRRGIPAVARGSAASSMVTYCLGISCVCPLRWGLYFERFLNEQRGDCPDIDIDICGARRDELLDYVYERWGEEHVAMIGSFVTMHARLAVREIAKVFGVPPAEVNYFTKRLPHRPVRDILQAIRDLPECRNLPVDDEPWKTILQVALRLDDAPRHMGIHPCGTVISAKPLTRITPLERATKGIVVTQSDMNAIEALGLIKMDLLGQRGFTTMSLALDNIEKEAEEEASIKKVKEEEEKSTAPSELRTNRSDGAAARNVAPDGMTPCPKARQIDFDAIPENDSATCDVIAAGKTMGVFQIESPAMRGLLHAQKARTLEEMAAALALIRPGAAEYGSKELYLKRLRGEEKVTYAHPSLETILGDTLGVCIFQEQVMQIAQAVGNMPLAEADLVRRSSAKYSGQRDRERLRGKFLKAAELMGLSGAEREETWMMVEKFAGFGFCKAHAATYADISYRMAYLKTHHPAEFLAAMCSAGAGFYHVSAYVEEAKRWGIGVLLPSVNCSLMQYTAEKCADGRKAVRVGLMQVRGLRVETIAAIVRAREERGKFCSLEDFLRRVPLERDEIEALIKCGALDDTGGKTCGMTRPEMLWRWNLLQAKEKNARQAGVKKRALPGAAAPPAAETLFAGMNAEEELGAALAGMPAADYTLEQRLRYEREILEVCVSGHPLDFLPRNGEAWSDALDGMRGKRVTLCGWVVTYRHVGTKNYRNMMFVTLEDQRGLYEVVLFPDAYDRYGGLVFETRAIRVTGRVEAGGQINGEKLEALRK
ncbi:MAG TPA: DNA polymerase III subunit alpha [Candidatus Acidoferrum sp.]|nr:DNA polymerase III subunit alpha [Candidatus Acidoferrum sp.]